LYFKAPEVDDSIHPRILLVSWSFPPDPAVGGLRWQQMSHHFADRGWRLDVLTRDFSTESNLDLARLESLSPGTRIYSVNAPKLLIGRLAAASWRLLRRAIPRRSERAGGDTLTQHEVATQRGPRAWMRSFLAWLEYATEGKWAHAAARAGTALARQNDYLVVISSGPPHMAHEASRIIAARTGLPFIVDMRDPWSFVQRFVEAVASPTWQRLASKHEQRVVRQAAFVTMNTDEAGGAMRKLYPEYASKIEVVRNGSDDVSIPAKVAKDDRFTIRFAGSIYADRDPRLVFRAVGQLITGRSLTPHQLAIQFVGDVDKFAGVPTMQIAEEEGISDFVSIGGRLRRQEALVFLGGATMLLSLPQDAGYSIPAKIYEYVKFNAWMLVLANDASPTARLLRGSDADVVDPEDVERITEVITRRYDQFSAGERPLPVGRDGRFDRIVQSRRMMELISRLQSADLQAGR
jgi:hypothetical protein